VANVVRLHGILTSIVSDTDKVFISSFWQTLFQLQGTLLCMSSNYHPQTDGQIEVVNRVLEQYLHCFVGLQPKTWMDWILWAEFSYNTSPIRQPKSLPLRLSMEFHRHTRSPMFQRLPRFKLLRNTSKTETPSYVIFVEIFILLKRE